MASCSDLALLSLSRWRLVSPWLLLACLRFAPPAEVSLQLTFCSSEAPPPPAPPPNRGGAVNKVAEQQEGGVGGRPGSADHLFSSSAAHPPRGGQATAGGQSRKSGTAEAGSPLLGNGHNPNMAYIPERRAVPATPTVRNEERGRPFADGMTVVLICRFSSERLVQHDAPEHVCWRRARRH